MVKFLFLRFWPVLIPLTLYLLWRRYRKRHQEVAPWVERLGGGLLLATWLVAIFCTGAWLYYAGTQEDGLHYVPSHLENGTLVPEQQNP